MPAFVVITRERTRDQSRLNECHQLVRVVLNNPPNFAPSNDATKSWKVPQSKKS